MREGWNSTALKNVCAVDKAKHNGKGLPYVGLEHIESGTGRYLGCLEPAVVKSATFRFAPNHVLYGRLRPYLNKVLLPDFDGHCSSEIFPLKVKTALDRQFLYHWLTWERVVKQIDKTSTGARMPRANVKKLLEFELPLPPLHEQKRIVGILDEAFAGIATAVANTEKNLANARELFESYLNSVFSERREAWKERKLGDSSLLEILDGDRGSNYPKKSDFYEQGYCLFVNTKNVRPDGFKFDSLMFITKDKDRALRKGKLKRRDVVLTTRGTIGNIGLYDDNVEFEHVRINSGMLVLRPNEKQVLAEYLFEMMRSSIIKKQIGTFVSGSAQPQLPMKTLVNFSLPVPSDLEQQRKMVSDLRELEVETKQLESIYQQKLTALAELKQSLLQKAFSGELTADKPAAGHLLKEKEVA